MTCSNVRQLRRKVTALRSFIPIVAVTLGAACASSGPHTPSGPSGGLTDGDIQQIAQLLLVADARRADTSTIDRALASPSVFVRSFAVRTVGQIGLTARAPLVRSLVADPDTMIAADAAFALGLLHDSTASQALSAGLARSSTVAAAAAWSLGELGDSGRSVIEGVLRSGEPSSALTDVLQAAAKLRPVPATLIRQYATSANVEVRRSAVYAVTRSRVPDATPMLLELAERLAAPSEPGAGPTDAEVDLRSYVARGLVRPAVSDPQATSALTALRRLVEDPHPHVRINAIRSLATYGSLARGDLVRHLRDPDPNARIALAQSLGGVLDSTPASWEAAWQADTSFTFRRALLSTAMRSRVRLASIDPATQHAWQRSTDWRYRAAAAEAAGVGSFTDVDAIAAPLLRDADARVRTAAYGATVAWADSTVASSTSYARAALRSALADSDIFVRATILGGLRPRARVADAAAALRAWHRASGDSDNDARLAALRVIASAWRADSASFGALRDSLTALTAPADPIERDAGRAIAPLTAWSRGGVTPRALAWYVDQARTFVAGDLSGRPAHVTMATSRGRLQFVLRGADAPLTVANFVQLARRGYYNGLVLHRVVPNFVAQDGDPRGDGSGGPGYAIRDELNRRWYDRGAVGMALSGPDTGGSQYFIAHSPQPHLDGHYTVFGHVTAGLDVLDALVQGDRILSVTIQ